MKIKRCDTSRLENHLQDTINFLKIVSEENRLKILSYLQRREVCVCEIWKCMDLPQNLVSHHLKVLRDFNLINSRREGTKVIYSANQKKIKKYSGYLMHYLKSKL